MLNRISFVLLSVTLSTSAVAQTFMADCWGSCDIVVHQAQNQTESEYRLFCQQRFQGHVEIRNGKQFCIQNTYKILAVDVKESATLGCRHPMVRDRWFRTCDYYVSMMACQGEKTAHMENEMCN